MRNKLKIAQISPGLIEIPPKSWGAIEKVIWNYKLQLEELGHKVDILLPWDIKDKYDIYHCHTFNQSLDDLKRNAGLDYIYSIHDHHTYLYGKNADLTRKNLLAMKKSIISITYAEYLIDFFDETDKLFYLPHGVDTKKYIDKNIKHTEHKLLCVANNGLANNPYHDRKGFRYSIEAAMSLNIPITIVGPENNRKFFDRNSDLLEYSKLKIIENPNEEELIDIYNDHTIFLHPSDLEAGHPNLTILEALSCGLPVIGTYLGKNELSGLIKIERDTNDVIEKIKYTINNYNYLKKQTLITATKYDWSVIAKKLEQMYYNVVDIKENFDNNKMRTKISDIYDNTEILQKESILPKIEIQATYVDGPKIEILSPINIGNRYNINFMENNNNVYSIDIGVNQWAKANKKYFIDWKTEIIDTDKNTINEIKLNLKNKSVLISIESSSLGDTLAWIPYVEEFRKKHNCIIYCSTFHNYLFEKEYSEIKFINPGDQINVHAAYRIGWFLPWGGSRDTNPIDYRIIPLQKTSSDILGLDYREIIPKISLDIKERPIKDKYICISEHSTTQAKYWNYPNGWQLLINHLTNIGYKIMVISKESTNLKNIIDETGDKPLSLRINQIYHSEFFIGTGSGLSWLAWAIGKKVVMISGFSNPDFEFKTNNIRIHNPYVCSSCFNKLEYEFDKNDWWWCPIHKGTDKQFICTKSITPEMVVEKMKSNNLI